MSEGGITCQRRVGVGVQLVRGGWEWEYNLSKEGGSGGTTCQRRVGVGVQLVRGGWEWGYNLSEEDGSGDTTCQRSSPYVFFN